MKDNSGQGLGVASVIMGAIAFGVQFIGGLLCGWIGWPLGIAAIITGIIAITKGSKGLGIIGIVLSVVLVIYQLARFFGFVGSIAQQGF